MTLDELILVICPKCGIQYPMVKAFHDLKERTGDSFCCPNGHWQHFVKPESGVSVAALQQEVAALKSSLVDLRHELEVSEAKRAELDKRLADRLF